MKTMILGSGGVGVATAYYLAKAGVEVVVVDRQPDAALETSFANAGQVSPGYASPWAAPGIPLMAIKWLFQRHAPLVIRPLPDPALWAWLVKMLRNCTQARYTVNKGRMLRLAGYSRACLQRLREETGISYDERTRGTLQLFRDQQGLDRAATRDAVILERYQVPHAILDREQCLQVEPGLRLVKEKIAGGLRLPNDETGDFFKFTRALAKLASELGVRFEYHTPIQGLEVEGGRISALRTAKGPLQADNYIVALGSYSPLLLKPIGIRVPIFPVKGYSATLPVINEEAAPVSTLTDEAHKVAITRLGDRIRVAGMAELAGYDLRLRKSRCATIAYVLEDLFPQGGDLGKAQYWTGLRPMTPDGPPVLGPTRYPNLFLNTGHGTLGWTMACGSGRVVADLITGQTPEVSLEGLTIARYG